MRLAPALTGITSNFTSPQTADSIEKRLPPPTTQEQAESDQDGHPDRVKREVAVEPKKGWGLESVK